MDEFSSIRNQLKLVKDNKIPTSYANAEPPQILVTGPTTAPIDLEANGMYVPNLDH